MSGDKQAYLVGVSRSEQAKRRKALLEKLDFRVGNAYRPEKVSVKKIVSEEAQEQKQKTVEERARHIEIVSLKEFAQKKNLFFELQDDNGNKFLLILKAVK